MKEWVKFACGHEVRVEVFGSISQREKKVAWLAKGICPDCYKQLKEKEQLENCKEVRMKYSEYKNEYSECETKRESYDKENKTIIVYVPKEKEVEILSDDNVVMDFLPKMEEIKALGNTPEAIEKANKLFMELDNVCKNNNLEITNIIKKLKEKLA